MSPCIQGDAAKPILLYHVYRSVAYKSLFFNKKSPDDAFRVGLRKLGPKNKNAGSFPYQKVKTF